LNAGHISKKKKRYLRLFPFLKKKEIFVTISVLKRMSKFEYAANLMANGRVGRRNEGRKIPFAITVENGVLRCVNEDGFSVSVQVPDDSAVIRVHCTLPNGAAIQCDGTIDPHTGTLRLDAVEREYAWFWFEICSKN